MSKETLIRMREANSGRLPAVLWPGGYPLFYLSADGQVWCVDCANQDAQPEVTDTEVNWEDANLYCSGCAKRIESAYAEDHGDL